MNVNTTSTATNAAYSNKGLSGMISGMDTEALVQSQLANIQNKIDKQEAAKQQLEWKQEQYRGVITKVNDFYDKYFDITSDTCLTLTSTFNKLTNTSSSSAIKVAGSSIAGEMSIQVAQLATKSTLTSGKVGASQIAIGLDESFFEATAQSVKLTAGDKSLDITVTSESNLDDVVAQINNSDLGIKAEVDEDGKLKLTSDDETAFSVEGTQSALSSLGLKAGAATLDETTDVYTVAGSQKADLTKVTEQKKDSATITFSLDGVAKTVTLSGEMTAESAAEEIAKQLAKAFGSSVKFENGMLSAGEGQRLSISGDVAAIGLAGPTSTGLALSDTLENSSFAQSLTKNENGNYTLTINGETLEFAATAKISDVISKVNSSDLGVTMSYNSLSDSFSLSANSTGAGFEINVDTSEGSLGAALFGNATFKAGQNAVATIDGVRVEKMQNSFTYNGVSMTFKSTTGNYLVDADGKFATDANGNFLNKDGTSAATETISSEVDTEAIVKLIKDFATDYNKLIEDLNGLTHQKAEYKEYAPLTEAQRDEMTESQITKWETKAKTGLLRNDSNITSFLTEMRSAFYTKKGTEVVASQVGIDTSDNWKEYGKLVIDEDALTKVLSGDHSTIVDLFTNTTGGLANQLKDACKKAANTSSASPGTLVKEAGVAGKVSEKNNYIQERIAAIESRLETLKMTYDSRKDRYWKQFNTMETMLGNMQQQSDYLYNMTYA